MCPSATKAACADVPEEAARRSGGVRRGRGVGLGGELWRRALDIDLHERRSNLGFWPEASRLPAI